MGAGAAPGGLYWRPHRSLDPERCQLAATGPLPALRAVGPEVLADTRQSGGGEDFSWYLEEVPGAMARLGVWSGQGDQLDLHQPTFDLDERALAIGVRVLVNIIEQAAAFE